MPRKLHFAALSTSRFDQVISALEVEFNPARFDCDVEDTWEYATAVLPGGIALNISRTANTDTIASWIAAAPLGVNWQVILASNAELAEAQSSPIRQVIERALGVVLAQYQ